MTTEGRQARLRWAGRLETFLGLRYIWSRSGNRFISFISLISMLGITIGVAVLIVVLSVVDGLFIAAGDRDKSVRGGRTAAGWPASPR